MSTTAAGLTFTLLPDRGLDLWTATYNGAPLPGSAKARPSTRFCSPWLRQFNGGVLVTCGLRHVGRRRWTIAQARYAISRRFHASAAYGVHNSRRLEGDAYRIELTGTVAEASLFGEQLRLSASIA